MKLTLGFSPCPNDTFIFDAIVNGKITQDDLQISPVIADIEALNNLSLNAELDITKISCSAYPAVSKDYQLLNAGSALGRNCGPLLVCYKDFAWRDLPKLEIAIPGEKTTANLLLNIFAREANKRTEYVFSAIEDAVIAGKADAGLVIHESRFTFEQKGLKKMADMGELWEQYTGLPLPLGCIAVRRTLPEHMKRQVEKWVHDSVRFAFDNPSASREFVMQNASEMTEDVQKKHIALYVNGFSLDLGVQGKKALELLFRKGKESGLLPDVVEPVYVT